MSSLSPQHRAALKRWSDLRSAEKVKRIKQIALILRLTSAALCAVLVVGVSESAPALFNVTVAFLFGWLVAESNALRTRIELWPVLMRNINWERVDQELQDE
jgi:hypothetical protein